MLVLYYGRRSLKMGGTRAKSLGGRSSGIVTEKAYLTRAVSIKRLNALFQDMAHSDRRGASISNTFCSEAGFRMHMFLAHFTDTPLVCLKQS
jgi:hypothetical protein